MARNVGRRALRRNERPGPVASRIAQTVMPAKAGIHLNAKKGFGFEWLDAS
jgi:hypothetical protein